MIDGYEKKNPKTGVPEIIGYAAATTTIDEIAKVALANSEDHGFWDGVSDFLPGVVGLKLALIHQELSEALDEYRKGPECMRLYFAPDGKPEGFGVELADAIIRIVDTYQKWRRLQAADNIETPTIGELIILKHEYNITRPHKHERTC